MTDANCTPPGGPGPAGFPAPWASDWGEDRCGRWQAFTYRGARQAFRWCPPGTFSMGSPEDERARSSDETQHEVRLTRGFWLAETACTQALWQAVMGEHPSRFQGGQRPVENVSWHDAQGFIERLNGILDAHSAAVMAIPIPPALRPSAAPEPPVTRLRLPTEAEWEYACRAGTTTAFSYGDDITVAQANYDGNYPYRGGGKGLFRRETVEVGSLPANPWGLFEMHGNVWEWCQDWYGDYSAGPVIDPTGPSAGVSRVLRGGSWISHARNLRSADRPRIDPGNRSDGFGFRLALGPEPGQASGRGAA